MVYHPVVSPDNSESLGHLFHVRRIKGSVKARRSEDRLVIRMVRQQQCQRHLRVALFCLLNYTGCKTVKSNIVPNKKSVTPYSAMCRSTA